MHLDTITAYRLKGQSLSLAEQVSTICQIARQLEKKGEYGLAREALIEFWPEPGQPPVLEGLSPVSAAEVLLRVGTLTSALASTGRTTESQESAKNLITGSIEIFEEQKEYQRAAEARGDLAMCYVREGAFDEARITVANSLASGPEENNVRATLLIIAGIVESWTQKLNDALQFYRQAEPLVERSEDEALKGSYHAEMAILLRRLSTRENQSEYLDRALIEYAAASYYFERVGNTRYCANVENNLAFLFQTIGRFSEAYEHINRARQLFVDLGDTSSAAGVDETRARALLAEGRLDEAERFARAAVKVLERGDEQSRLTEALNTRGVVMARLGKHAAARASLERAIEVAEIAGDLEGAGHARLSMVEELEQQTSPAELAAFYQSAVDLLKQSQDPTTARRLIACSQRVIGALETAESVAPEPEVESWNGFSLKQQTLQFERALIERALRDSGGAVTKAARLLGLNNHQCLIAVLNGRHKDLADVRTAVRVRRRTLMSSGKGKTTKGH
jgi:tetratricopeptide (TPR) repeat protein